MRVGILTVPFNNNYGGFLQAFALKKILVDLGHEVIFINRRRNKIKIPLIKYFFAFPYYYYKEKKNERQQLFLSQNTNIFIEKYLSPMTEDYYNTKQLRECLKYNFDAIIVGSDQVWRYRYAKDSIDDFFCNFLEGSKTLHIAYAASFGTHEQEFPTDKLKICSKLIDSFSMISVREFDGKNLLIKHFGLKEKQVNVVLDPTMLIPICVYKELFKDIEIPKDKYVFTYVLDKNEEIKKFIDDFCEEKQFKEFSISAQTGKISKMNPIEPVELWLSRIYHAEYIITDSFHGTVFSILFNKPFVVLGNKIRGNSRFITLLDTFNLGNHYIKSFSNNKIDFDFDWTKVNDILSMKRKDSQTILVNSLF